MGPAYRQRFDTRSVDLQLPSIVAITVGIVLSSIPMISHGAVAILAIIFPGLALAWPAAVTVTKQMTTMITVQQAFEPQPTFSTQPVANSGHAQAAVDKGSVVGEQPVANEAQPVANPQPVVNSQSPAVVNPQPTFNPQPVAHNVVLNQQSEPAVNSQPMSNTQPAFDPQPKSTTQPAFNPQSTSSTQPAPSGNQTCISFNFANSLSGFYWKLAGDPWGDASGQIVTNGTSVCVPLNNGPGGSMFIGAHPDPTANSTKLECYFPDSTAGKPGDCDVSLVDGYSLAVACVTNTNPTVIGGYKDLFSQGIPCPDKSDIGDCINHYGYANTPTTLDPFFVQATEGGENYCSWQTCEDGSIQSFPAESELTCTVS